MKLTLLWIWLAFSMLAAAADGPRLAILADASAKAEAELLTVELSQQPVQLLERAEIERVLAEQRLALAGLAPAELTGLGRLLKADGLIFLAKEGVKEKQALALRCVAVHPGVVVESWREEAPAEPAKWSRAAAARFKALLPKFVVRAEAAVPVSVLNLRVTRARPEAAELERELTVLLTHRLAHEPALFVLERQQMAALEKEKSAADAPFWTGRWLIDGSIEQALADPDALTIAVRLRAPGGGEASTVRHTCRRNELTAAAEALAQGIARALKQEPVRGAWEVAVEPEQFWREAQWAFRNQLNLPAARAAEAAWALGLRRAEVLAVRVRGELYAARPSELMWVPYPDAAVRDFILARTWHWRADLPQMSGVGMPRVTRKAYQEMSEPEREERLRGTLRGVELTRDHYDLAVADPLLANQSLLHGALLLEWLADNREGAFDDGTRALQQALRELAARQTARLRPPGKAEPRDRGAMEFWQLRTSVAPLLAQWPAETLAFWREALALHLGADSDAKVRVALAHSHDLYPALAMEKRAQTSEADKLWDELVAELEASEFAGDRLLAAFGRHAPQVETWRADLPPPLAEAYWKERARFATGELPFDYVYLLALPQGSHAHRVEAAHVGPKQVARFDFARRLLLHLLAESTYVDLKVFDHLYHPDVYTEGEAREMHQALVAYGERIRQQRRDDVFQAAIRERMPELLVRFPQLAGAAPEVALKVTRYWHPYRPPGVDAKLKRASPSIYTGSYAENRLWFCLEFDDPVLGRSFLEKPYHIFAVDLKTFETEAIACPPPPRRELGKTSFGGNHVVVTPEALYVSHVMQLARFDRRARTWSYYPEITNVFSQPWLVGGRLYLRTDNWPKADQLYHMGDVVELNPATGATTLLSSDRRTPPEAPLDSWPVSQMTVHAGPEGKVLFRGIAENRSGTRYAAYDSAAKQWTPLDEAAWKQAAGAEPDEWKIVARQEGTRRLFLERGERKLEFRCELSAEDRAALAQNGGNPPLEALEGNMSRPWCRTTPDGLVIIAGSWTPGFWFVPNADLERTTTKPKAPEK